MSRPSNTPVQHLVFWGAVLLLGLHAAVQGLPEPDPAWTVQCPNHSGPCGTPKAITFGYLGQ